MCPPPCGSRRSYRCSTRTRTVKTPRERLMDLLRDSYPSECINYINDEWKQYEGCVHNLHSFVYEVEPDVTLLKSKDKMYKKGYKSFQFDLDAWTGTYPVIVRFHK